MKGRILTSLLTVIVLTGLQAQNVPAVPKLVVGLTIDQLRTDYIEAFSALYGERGFKRLWKEGRIYLNAEYDLSMLINHRLWPLFIRELLLIPMVL